MPLIINEEQSMLKASAKEFLKDRSPVEALRKLRDNRDEYGYDRSLWREMTDMGWACLTIPESYGGLDFGYLGLGQILEEMGRTLTASPMISTVLLGSTAINLAGNHEQKSEILPSIADGGLIVTMAMDENKRHQPFQIQTTATKNENGYVINGSKVFVLDGHVADKLVVVARTSGNKNDRQGLSLFLLDTDNEGVTCDRVIMMDIRNSANIQFNNVQVSDNALLGEVNNAADILEKVLDIGRIGLSAEMLGTMSEAFDRTIAYLKERQQFGVTIGSFQALQHRAAQMYCEIELCKSLVLKSLQAIDENDKNLSVLASMTKAKINKTLQLVTNEAVQMFGGVGMTDDEEIGFFLKRARVAQQTLGDSSYHLNRFARLNGY